MSNLEIFKDEYINKMFDVHCQYFKINSDTEELMIYKKLESIWNYFESK